MNEDFTDFVLRPDGWQESRPAPLSDAAPVRNIMIAVCGYLPGNADRANRGGVMRLAHQQYTESEELPRVADLLADLMHHCKAEGVDFHVELNVGADFFAQEDGSDEI